jgi:hypothetical protein
MERLITFVCLAFESAASLGAAERRLNVLFIAVDDMNNDLLLRSSAGQIRISPAGGAGRAV